MSRLAFGESRRLKGQRIKKLKASRPKAQLRLRGEPRHRPAVDVRVADPEGVHLEHAVAEADARGVRELAVAAPRHLVARTVDPEIVVVLEAVGMRE